ncbi:MAG TPA: AI-2E family transporter [Polyangiales bacterium]
MPVVGRLFHGAGLPSAKNKAETLVLPPNERCLYLTLHWGDRFYGAHPGGAYLGVMNPPDPVAADVAPPSDRNTLRVLGGVLTVAALALVFDLWPWLLLAIWAASITKPLGTKVFRRAADRKRAAAVITIGLLLALLVPLAAGIGVLVPDVIDVAQRVQSADSGSKSLKELVAKREPEDEPAEDKPESETTEPKKIENTDAIGANPEQLIDMAREHGTQAVNIARPLAGALGSFALGVFTFFVAVYATLLHGDAAYAWLRARLPLSARATDRLRDAYQETGRGLLYSVGLTALLQGGLAAIAYVSLGVPRGLALGLATIITSLIPAIGPFLVWGPVALGLYLVGHPIKAAILAGVGVIIVAPADNLLRPLLAKRGKLQLDPFVVFFAMVGGIALIGGWGLMVGPLVFRMAREVIDMLYEQRAHDSEAAPARVR